MRRTRQWACALLLLVPALIAVTPVAAADPVGETDWVWPATGRISQLYGCTGARTNGPSGSCRHFHNGLDIANKEGTAIRAARPGLVTFVGWNPWESHDPAWIVTIDHGDGLITWYAHMLPQPILGAGVGSWVEAGDVVGWMGNTGRSTGVHLHFMVQRGRDFIDPKLFLTGSPRGSDSGVRGGGATDALGAPLESLLARSAGLDELTRPVLPAAIYPR